MPAPKTPTIPPPLTPEPQFFNAPAFLAGSALIAASIVGAAFLAASQVRKNTPPPAPCAGAVLTVAADGKSAVVKATPGCKLTYTK